MKRKPNGFDRLIKEDIILIRDKKSKMKIVNDKDRTVRQGQIFDIANDIYKKANQTILDELSVIADMPLFHEMADWEVISFFANIYTKIFCHGFCTMMDLKSKKLKEHESTKRELLDEWVQGIYAMLEKQRKKDDVTPQDGIKRIKVE